MANIYFGAYDYTGQPAFTNNWNTISNWYSSPGGAGGCCCVATPGTPSGRLPTTADTVIIIDRLITPYSGGAWSGPVIISGSSIEAGTFSGQVTLSGGSINGGTYNGNTRYDVGYFNGGTFNTLSPTGNATLFITGGTFNGVITGAGSPGVGSARMEISGGIFNTAIPNTFHSTSITGGTFDRDLNLGLADRLVSVLIGNTTGFVLNRNINLDLTYYYYNTFQNRNIGSGLTVKGGTFNGNINISKTQYSGLFIEAGNYNPTTVITPAIKSGNYMSFSSSSIPTDWGFKAVGGTFNPTINLSGTSNEILGTGLI